MDYINCFVTLTDTGLTKDSSAASVRHTSHISCDLMVMPSPMKKPNETPDPIIAMGMTANERNWMAW